MYHLAYIIWEMMRLSTNELIEDICKSLGKKAHVWKLPNGLMNGMAKLGCWLHLSLIHE